MWLLYAAGSAFFAGLTSILAKCGIRKTDSTVATAVRTIVILIFSWLIVGIVGSGSQITSISSRTLVFLILSGAATGASWLCYFKALQLGDSVPPGFKTLMNLFNEGPFITIRSSITSPTGLPTIPSEITT